jgi:lipopolysaccharide biosynthesis glycosyltransferase
MNKWTKFPRQWNIFRPKARIIHFAGDPKPWTTCSIKSNEDSCINPDEAMLLWLRKFREMYTNRHFDLEDFQMGYAPKDMGYNVTEMLEVPDRKQP